MGLVQVSLLDGISLAVGASFIIASIFGLILTRRTGLNITWGLGTLASIIISVISGILIMTSLGFFFSWTGSAIHGLTSTDLTDWTTLISTEFGSYPYQVLALTFIGALGGHAMGYAAGTRPKDEATTFATVFSILGVSAIAIGLTLTLLQNLLAQSLLVLFSLDGLFALLFILVGFWIKRNESVEIPVESSSSDIN